MRRWPMKWGLILGTLLVPLSLFLISASAQARTEKVATSPAISAPDTSLTVYNRPF